MATKTRFLLCFVLVLGTLFCLLACGGKDDNSVPDAKTAETTDPSTSANMIHVPGGTFMMGSNEKEDDEQPVHQVTLSPFYIGKYEVTQAEWKEVMGRNPSFSKGDNLPVEQVSWFDAVDYCNKRSVKEGLTPCYSGSGDNISCDWGANGYRLPTEAEWEHAARGGNKSQGYAYSGSNDIGSVAWYWLNSDIETHEVGTKAANELGIYDMSGNVFEWCWDWYAFGYYAQGPGRNPKGAGSGSGRVLRGGYFGNDAYSCTVSYRGNYGATDSSDAIGFRICRVSP